MGYRFTLRRLDEGHDPTKQARASTVISALRQRLMANTKGPWTPIVDGEPKPRRDDLHDLLKTVNRLIRLPNGPRAVVIKPKFGPRFLIKKFGSKEQPIADTTGTRGIDRIWTAVHERFDDQWYVRELGICAPKPGEHGHCNAWDAGTNIGVAAEVTHQRIQTMAAFIREQGVMNQAHPTTGLAVNGVIVLDHYWERGMGRIWRHYSGVPHVTHFHVSAHPSITGWV